MANSPLILVDGSSYLFRAYHALPQFSNKAGQPTGAIYGVINMLKKLLADYQPSYCAVIFDAKGPTFRHQLYPDYKATRPPMAEELALQIQPLHEIIKCLGLPLIVESGVEADDVIGTLALSAVKQGFEVIISTGDKDMAQLVNDKITLINTMNDSKMDPAGVVNKFGVTPSQITDYLTLVGDSVDNIPGVEKVGPKTAAKWLAEFDSLTELAKHADSIKGKIGENFRQFIPKLELTKQLVTIKCNVELKQSIDDLQIIPADKQRLRHYFTLYEFKNWLAKLDQNNSDAKQTQYQTITTTASLKEWLDRIGTADFFCFDLETTNLDTHLAKIVGIAIATEVGDAAYIPLAHDYPNVIKQLDLSNTLALFKPLLEAEHPVKLGQNLKYDMGVLANYNIELNGVSFDTMLESYVIDSTANRHDLDTLALKHLDHKMISFTEVAGKGSKQITFDKVDIFTATQYAAEDADITMQLHQQLWPTLSNDQSLLKVYTDIEQPLIPVLSNIERHGVLIDKDMLLKQSLQLAERIAELETQAFTIADSKFNLSSPKQLQEILYDKLNLPILQKTPTGQPSTAEQVLHELSAQFELPKIILEHRSLSKLKSTYTDKLPDQINTKTGRIHTSYHQAVTATGRLSSSDPNLQNIPIRTEQGRMIRQAFIAPAGYNIIAADYSQIELRIMAHLSQDPGLLSAFSNNLDIHKATAAEIFSISVDDVTTEQRRHAKAVNFGLMYGMSAFGLARQLEVDRKTAAAYIERYFERYPKIHDYMESTRTLAHEQGYVETLFGRRLYLPDINAKQIPRQKAAERTAINAPLQGSAADIIKRAMLALHHWLKQEKIDAYMIMQVHDELVFEVNASITDQIANSINQAMSSAAELCVPLLVDIGIGSNWQEAH